MPVLRLCARHRTLSEGRCPQCVSDRYERRRVHVCAAGRSFGWRFSSAMATSATGAGARRRRSITCGQSSTGESLRRGKRGRGLPPLQQSKRRGAHELRAKSLAQGESWTLALILSGARDGSRVFFSARARVPRRVGVHKHRRQGGARSTPLPFFGRNRTLRRLPRKLGAGGRGRLPSRGRTGRPAEPTRLLFREKHSPNRAPLMPQTSENRLTKPCESQKRWAPETRMVASDRGARRRASRPSARLAMQKVEGSSPFIRFKENPA